MAVGLLGGLFESSVKVTASDNALIEPLISYDRSSCSIYVCSVNAVQLQKICCTFTGSVRVKTTIQANSTRSSARLMAYFQVQRNGNVIYTSGTYTAIRETALEVDISLDIYDLQPGDYILFYGYTNGSGMDFTGYANPLTVCGTII